MLDFCRRALGHSGIPFAQSILSRMGAFRVHPPAEFVVPWRGIRYQGNKLHWVDRYIYFMGAYAPAELDFLERAAKVLKVPGKRITLLDIGANVGQHSLAMHRQIDRILAFEPNPVVAARLKINMKANNIHNIELYEVALGDRNGVEALGSGLPGNDGSRSLNWSMDKSATTDVPLRHAGEYLAELVPSLKRIDLIKLDVEGYEKAVLGALQTELWRDRPIILFELVGSDIKGGFGSEKELRATLYENHFLFGLRGRRQVRLSPFLWSEDVEAVCLPAERVSEFKGMMV